MPYLALGSRHLYISLKTILIHCGLIKKEGRFINKNDKEEMNAKIGEELKSLKADMQDILNKIHNLSSYSNERLVSEVADFIRQLRSIKGQGQDIGTEYLEKCANMVKSKPVSSVIYSFFAGALLSYLWKK